MMFAFSGLARYVASDERRVSSVIDRILDRNNELQFVRSKGLLERFAGALSAHRYSIAFRENEPTPLSEIWKRHHVYFRPQEEHAEEPWDSNFAILESATATWRLEKN